MRSFVIVKAIALILLLYSINCRADDLSEAMQSIKFFLVTNEQCIKEYYANHIDVLHSRYSPSKISKLQKWREQLPLTNLKVDSKNDWNCIVSTLYDIRNAKLYTKGEKLSDDKLFKALLTIYAADRNRFQIFGLFFLFKEELLLADSEAIFDPLFEKSTTSTDNLLIMYANQITPAILNKHADFFSQAKKNNWFHIYNDAALETRVHLWAANAAWGDAKATQQLTDAFLHCPTTGRTCGYFYTLLDAMFSLRTHASLFAILSRFHEENVSSCLPTKPSVRYKILSGFYRLHPDDWFFIKYKSYFVTRHGEPFPGDEKLGGVEGVKRLFKDFQKWIKERYGYNLDLSGASYRINLSKADEIFFD